MAVKVFNVVLICAVISTAYGLSIELPKECEGKPYCLKKPADFPQKLFDDHIREKEKSIIRNKRYEGEPREVIHNSDPHNCHTKVTIIQPFIVRSNTTMKLVVQTNIFQQWIKQTECLNTGGACFTDVLKYKPSYTSACTPTDGTIKLYLYDPAMDRFEHEGVTFPVCCSCSIMSNI